MKTDELYQRYQELQQYVGWTDEDAQRVRSLAPIVEPHFDALIEDFYAEIERHPKAQQVITGGPEQVERLKGTLKKWLRELLSGEYDTDYVIRRWKVGYRHVEIGLEQVYTNVALSRLRIGMAQVVHNDSSLSPAEKMAAVRSLHKLLDLDLAIIEQAYQEEYAREREEAERLAVIGQVAGGIAHELRNPLNVIQTSVYYLLNARNPSPSKTSQHLDRIKSQVGLAENVISALSNFAKLPIPKQVPFSVLECVGNAVEMIPRPDHVEISIDCPETLPPAVADQDQILIVISNLIRNARDAMPDGGKISVSGRLKDENIHVAVCDNGPGIQPENLNQIMEPFYSTKARGIGLGLAISRAIVDKNRGILHAQSEVGQGSTFSVILPASPTESTILN